MASRARWLWRDKPEPVRRQLRAYYRALEARRGIFADRVESEHAVLATETWYTTRHASATAVDAVVARGGKGRRPNVRAVNSALKRQGLGVGSLGAMLKGLTDLSAQHPPTPAELVAEVNGRIRREVAQAAEADR